MTEIRSMTKDEAERELIDLIGWPMAHIVERGEYGDCIIVAHGNGCTCGHCPVLHDDGSMQ